MFVYLDTETTGFSPARGASIVEIAIVDDEGRTLMDTLVDPRTAIPYQATAIHGITNEMVRGQPTLDQLIPSIRQVISRHDVVIYNSNFDVPFFPDRLGSARQVHCAMRRFADSMDGRWWKLEAAARHVKHRWSGQQHRALADALACRSVWRWLES